MKWLAESFVLCVLLVGCGHSPARYPGAGGDNLDPKAYASVACPNLSGRYEGLGVLIEGDANAQKMNRFQGINSTFPFRDSTESAQVRQASLSTDGRYRAPEYGDVVMDGRRAVVRLRFPGGKSAEFVASFEDKNRFVCTGQKGKIVWGGASEGGRSEFGPNSSDSIVMLYLDENGDLISEEGMQVHMNLRLGNIPTGTAKYFSKHRFKRLQ